MSIEEIRKRVDRELQEAQQRTAMVVEEKRQRELSYPTVKEWDEAVVSFANRMYKALFPGAWSGPKIVGRMAKFGSSQCHTISGIPRHFGWKFIKQGISLSFEVVIGGLDSDPWPDPRKHHDTLCIREYRKLREFHSVEELESAFEEIFDKLYRELVHKTQR